MKYTRWSRKKTQTSLYHTDATVQQIFVEFRGTKIRLQLLCSC